jgi:YD repeat-containing protein
MAIPYREYAIESNTPFTKTNTEITTTNNNNVFTFDSKYKVKGEYTFDQYCNLINYLKTDDSPLSFYYGYASTLPVIEGKNVTCSVLNAAVAGIYSNFEVFLTSLGDMSTTSEHSDWRSFNSSLRAVLPADARVVTYTYVPMIGMTSKTDENGIAIYYTYDKLGRLIFEKDNNGNIIKRYDYHYANN